MLISVYGDMGNQGGYDAMVSGPEENSQFLQHNAVERCYSRLSAVYADGSSWGFSLRKQRRKYLLKFRFINIVCAVVVNIKMKVVVFLDYSVIIKSVLPSCDLWFYIWIYIHGICHMQITEKTSLQ